MKSDFFDQLPKTRIFFRDCTAPLTGEDVFEVGDSRIVTTAAGTYRENAAQDNSRFGYRFTLRTIDKPHLIELVYPDDRPRSICVQDGTSYDLTMGLITGYDCPLTGTMQKAYNVFWPRALDQSILVASLSGEEPAAAASIAVYELEELPVSDIPSIPGTRTIGIQYEDPCNIGGSEGAVETGVWVERHIQFMRSAGQNRLVYPVNWYHGPIIPVKSQPAQRGNVVVHPYERRKYCRSAAEFPDWLDTLLTAFDKEGFHFTGSLTLLRLGNLLKGMNIDEESIASGADTYNNVLYNGMVQSSTNDWTRFFNPVTYPEAVTLGCPWSGGQEAHYAYGERLPATDVRVPMFNPLHPEVQKQVLEYFEEIVSRYAHHPSFEGLSVNFWHATILWFGNLLTGYDDTCAAQFSADTGITLPVDASDPNRFAKRYAWLMKNARDAWIAWRCEKVCAFLRTLRDRIRAVRADLTLTVHMWNETSVGGHYPNCEGFPSPGALETQYGSGDSLYEVYRRGGIDLAMLENEPGIRVCVERNFCRNAAARLGNEVHSRHLTDPMRLDEELFAHLHDAKQTEGFHFNCWEERWGRTDWFASEEGDAQIMEEIRDYPDYHADFIFRENSVYADEDKGPFFYPNQTRITSLFPPEKYYSEQMITDLALHDALSVTLGGLYLDKQHLPETRAFAQEYRKLPAKKFKDVQAMTDPVCMRYLHDNGYTWVYVLNREPYEIAMSFALGEQNHTLTLEPFGLRVFEAKGELVPNNIAVDMDPAIVNAYTVAAEKALAALAVIPENASDALVAGRNKTAARIRTSLENGAYTTLRHLLYSYHVRLAIYGN